MQQTIIHIIIIFFLTFPYTLVIGQNDSIKKKPFHLGATYYGDLVNNIDGGLKQGTCYLGFGCVEFGFDSNKSNLWKGGEFLAKIGNTHGGLPSDDLVGDFMGVSNIEAGNLTFLYELRLKQKVSRLYFTLGLQDLNSTFAYSTYGSFLNNSSFGLHSSISDNIPTPVFPLTALGAVISWNISKSFTFHTAIFDGSPDQYGSNPFDLKWKLNKYDGLLSISELNTNVNLFKNRPGYYKIGYYYHMHNDTSIVHFTSNYGLYANIDQLIIKNRDREGGIAVFTQVGFSPKSKNEHNHFYSFGIEYIGISKKRSSDVIGIAIAHAGFDKSTIGSETTFELAYKAEVIKQVALKPDIQYIINPAGTVQKLNNALVATIRIEISL